VTVENMMSAFLALVVLALLFSRDRLKMRVSRLEVRLEKLLRHVGFDPDPNPPATADIAVLARTPGGKIAAIKAYREQTGAGLREAKAEVERLMEQGG
jgi:ribosomal protein L7/L12